jgi:putative tricarboxylic transport membrane protein
MKKFNAGVWVGLVIAVLAVVFFFLSLKFPYTSYVGPGAGFFPFWVCLTLFIFSVLLAIESYRHGEKVEDFLPKGKKLRAILMVLGALVLYVASITFLGYISASVIFLFILFYNTFKWYVNLGVSIGVALLMFLLFKVFLQIPLPLNIFGF